MAKTYTPIEGYPSFYFSKNKFNEVEIYVRLLHNGKKYGYKNITKYKKVSSDKLYVEKGKLKAKTKGGIKEALLNATLAKREIIKDYDNGIDPFAKEKRKRYSVNDFFDEYLALKKGRISEKNYDGKKWFYDKHIRKSIGKYAPHQIRADHLLKILNSTLKGLSWRTIKEFKTILSAIFRISIRDGIMKSENNPFLDEEVKYIVDEIQRKPKVKITERTVNNIETVVKKLYNQCLDIKINKDRKLWLKHLETKTAILIAITTVRRRGEILKLKYSMISVFDENSQSKRVDVNPMITKTKIWDNFPLPKECLELIKLIKEIKNAKEDDNIFTEVEEHLVSLWFKNLVKDANIQLAYNQKITLHNLRDIFATTMGKRADRYVVELCLSHTPPKIMGTYVDIEYEDKAEVFFDYWSILRN